MSEHENGKYQFRHREKRYYITKSLQNIVNEYDYFIVGSDQVWNHEFKTFNSDMFLSFSKKQKNISYAASFGFDDLDKGYMEMYRKGINNFKSISVREHSGKEIIAKLDEKVKVETVVDPTLLLEEKKWEDISFAPKISLPTKFILVYFLGRKSNEINEYIKNVSQKNDWQVIDIMDKSNKYFCLGPSEFLYLEKNAQLVCTDSFHSTVFSIIFKTPFLVFEREDSYKRMSSRLEDLLKMTKLETQKVKSFNAINYENIDFTGAEKAIKKERTKALNYLKANLK